MNFLAMAAAYLSAPAKGGVQYAPTRTEVVGMSIGTAAVIAGGIVLVALALKKGR